MRLLGKKKPADEEEEVVVEKKKRKQVERSYEQPKDPTRWLPLLFLVIFLFLSYLFWIPG